MILDRDVKLRWNKITEKHYKSKGYILKGYNEKITVKIEDLHPRSSVKVQVKCGFCEEVFSRVYRDVINSIDKSFTKKYCCVKCEPKKRKLELAEKQSRGLLNREDKGYLNYRENRIKELLLFIDENKTVNNMQYIYSGLYSSILKFDKSVKNLTDELGIRWSEISTVVPNGYYHDFSVIEKRVLNFIKEYDRFPSSSEFYNVLKINSRDVVYHGGVEGVKSKLGYLDEKDLVDDRGFVNRSRFEYTVAQYLIANNIHYKREQFPFHNSNHRCDFLITETSGRKYYVEVWGFGKNDKSLRGIEYNASRDVKESIYKENNLSLISLEYEYLERKTPKKVQEYLKDKFSRVKEVKLRIFEDSMYLHPKSLSNEMILTEIMKYSKNTDTLPTTKVLQQNGMQFYHNEILKRFESYSSFAEYFNKNIAVPLWNEERVMSKLGNIVKEGKAINKKTMTEQGLLNATSFISKHFGTFRALALKLKYYNEYWNGEYPISSEDIEELEEVAIYRKNDKRIKDEEIRIARIVLNKIEKVS